MELQKKIINKLKIKEMINYEFRCKAQK